MRVCFFLLCFNATFIMEFSTPEGSFLELVLLKEYLKISHSSKKQK